MGVSCTFARDPVRNSILSYKLGRSWDLALAHPIDHNRAHYLLNEPHK